MSIEKFLPNFAIIYTNYFPNLVDFVTFFQIFLIIRTILPNFKFLFDIFAKVDSILQILKF